jgi:5'-nucleotidase
VKFAVLRHEDEPFDLVVSGVNLGINAGVDLFYSGTVAGAMEGALHGISSVALSTDRANARAMDEVAATAARLLGDLAIYDLQPGYLFNINIPVLGNGVPSWEFTRQSPTFPGGILTATDGTRGRRHYWLDAAEDGKETDTDTDVNALAAGRISVTPLRTGLTDEARLARLREQHPGGGRQ